MTPRTAAMATAAALLLAACGNGDDDPAPEPSPEARPETDTDDPEGDGPDDADADDGDDTDVDGADDTDDPDEVAIPDMGLDQVIADIDWVTGPTTVDLTDVDAPAGWTPDPGGATTATIGTAEGATYELDTDSVPHTLAVGSLDGANDGAIVQFEPPAGTVTIPFPEGTYALFDADGTNLTAAAVGTGAAPLIVTDRATTWVYGQNTAGQVNRFSFLDGPVLLPALQVVSEGDWGVATAWLNADGQPPGPDAGTFGDQLIVPVPAAD